MALWEETIYPGLLGDLKLRAQRGTRRFQQSLARSLEGIAPL